MSDTNLSKPLTKSFRTYTRRVQQTDVYLEVATAAKSTDELNKIVNEVNKLSDGLLKIRVEVNNAKTKQNYVDEMLKNARSELQTLAGEVEEGGEEADKLTSFRAILDRSPYAATVLLAFLIERPELAERAWEELDSRQRQTWRQIVRQVDKDTIDLSEAESE